MSSSKTLTNDGGKEDAGPEMVNGVSRETTENGDMERPSGERGRRIQVGVTPQWLTILRITLSYLHLY